MPKESVVPITKEEMDRLMTKIEETDEFDYMLFSTLRYTGRRIGELTGIEERKRIGDRVIGSKTVSINGVPTQVDKTTPQYEETGNIVYGVQVKDVDLENGRMKVWVLKRKNYIQDETTLSPELIRIIGRYIRKNGLTLNNYLFRKKDRGRRQIRNIIKTYAKKAGIEHVVVTHNFRHYFITELRRQGWTNEDIKVLTGHKQINSLAAYEHITPNDLKNKQLEAMKSL